MKKRWLTVVLFILLALPISAYTLADYPDVLFRQGVPAVVTSRPDNSGQRVATNMLIADLQRTVQARRLRQPVPVLAATKNMTSRDEVVIGEPCANLHMRELLKLSAGQCQAFVKRDQGLLLLVQDENVHVIITGSNGDRILDAVKVLLDKRQRAQLTVPRAPVERRTNQKYYVIGGRRFLDIGQTIGAATPALYSGYPYVTYSYNPQYPAYPRDNVEYAGNTYGAILAKTRR